MIRNRDLRVYCPFWYPSILPYGYTSLFNQSSLVDVEVIFAGIDLIASVNISFFAGPFFLLG